MHLLRAFPVRSYNESLKGRNTFLAIPFYVKSKQDNKEIDLSKPYLTYNQPVGKYKAGRPVLLDFLIKNCQLTKDGYKVRLNIDGVHERLLTDWIPYYIYGLVKGTHKIHLELLSPQNTVVPGVFNNVWQEITIE